MVVPVVFRYRCPGAYSAVDQWIEASCVTLDLWSQRVTASATPGEESESRRTSELLVADYHHVACLTRYESQSFPYGSENLLQNYTSAMSTALCGVHHPSSGHCGRREIFEEPPLRKALYLYFN